jgi:hypothetical protein
VGDLAAGLRRLLAELDRRKGGERMPVEIAPGFCSCGNLARATCDLCKVGRCEDCDVLSRPLADLDSWPVRVTGFGYVNRAWDYRYRHLNLTARDGGAYGPFLYLNELLSCLAAAHGFEHRNGAGPVGHLCQTCLHTAIPETAERIANGLMCETPRCVNEPCERCRCCRGAFCEECLTLIRPLASVPCRITWTEPDSGVTVDGEVLYPIGATIERSAVPTALHGLCGICGAERHHRQRDMSAEILANRYAGVLVPSPHGTGATADGYTLAFELPAIKRRTRRGRESERARAQAVVQRCAAEMTELLEQLPVGDPCRRALAFAEGEQYAYYVVLDQRSQLPPAGGAGAIK